jgi:hypothetical protein
VGDFVHFSQRVPLIPMERRMNLLAVAAARQALFPRPSWCMLFVQAYARICARRPELRRAYLRWPCERLYEHTTTKAGVVFERRLGQEEAVLVATLATPEQMTVPALNAWFRQHQEQPVPAIAEFARALWLTSLPRPLRRFVWWLGLDWFGAERAQFFGTFGVSVTAGLGAGALLLLSPWTTALHYGVMEADGMCPVRLTFDHRVLDGANMARVLVELEAELNGSVLRELHDLGRNRAA